MRDRLVYGALGVLNLDEPGRAGRTVEHDVDPLARLDTAPRENIHRPGSGFAAGSGVLRPRGDRFAPRRRLGYLGNQAWRGASTHYGPAY
jgi:hypothetical protein